MKKYFLILFLVFYLFSGGSVCAEVVSDNRAVKNILMLTSFQLNDDWTGQLSSSIMENSASLPFRLNYEITTLDALRIGKSKIWDSIFRQSLSTLQRGHYSMIVALDDAALDVVLRHAGEIPPEIPVVFAGYENSTTELKKIYPNITGVTQEYDIGKTIHVGLKLFPETTHVMMLADPKTAKNKLADFAAKEQCKHGNVQFLYLSEDSLNSKDIFDKLKELPEETLVFFIPWRAICDEEYHSMQAFSTDLSKMLKRPYLMSLDPLYGYGGLGGFGASAASDGKQTANLIRRVLESGSAIDIPIEAGRVVPHFDYNVMVRNNLDFKQLPANAVLYNQPPSLWRQAETYWLIAGVVLSLVICGMLIHIVMVKKAVRRRYEFFNELPGRIGVVNSNWDILYLNAEAKAQYSVKSIKNIKDFPSIDHAKVISAMQKAMDSGERVTLEYAVGEIKRILVISKLPHQIFGESTVVWVSMDNAELQNERARADEYAAQLQHTMKLWDALINTLPIHIYAQDPDDGFKYAFCNHALCDFLGHAEAEIIGRTNFELFPEKDCDRVHELDVQAMHNIDQGLNTSCVTYAYDAAANRHSFRLVRKLFTAEDGKRLLLGAAIDVSEQQEALMKAQKYASELERSTKLWDTLLNSLPVHIFAKNPDDGYKYIFCNRAVEEFFGVNRTDVIGKDDAILFPAEAARKIIAADRMFVNTPEMPFEETVNVCNKNGRHRIFRTVKRIVTMSESERLILGMSLDVTDLENERSKNKQLNDELTDMLAQNAILLDNMQVFVFTKDIDHDFRYLSCNAACVQVLGRPVDEIIGKNDFELLTSDELSIKYREADMEAAQKGELKIELPFLTRAGASRVGDFYMKRLELSGGRNVLFVLCIDITEQKLLSLEQENALQLLRELIDAMPCHVVAKDINDGLRYTLCNKAFQEMVGLPAEQIIGHFDHELFASNEECMNFVELDMKAVNSQKSTEHIMNFTGVNGMHIGHAHWMPLKLAGDRNWLFMVVDDITELEKTRRLAEETAERLNLTLNSIGDGVLATDVNGNIVMLNPVAERMTGYRQKDVIGIPHEQVFKIITYNDGAPAPSPLTRTLRTGTIVELANHTDLIAKNGQQYHISDSAAPIRDRDGNIIGAILVFRDVTEEYIQRDNLRRIVSMMEAGAEATNTAVFFCDVGAGTISGSKLLNKLMPGEPGLMPKELNWIFQEDRQQFYDAWKSLRHGECDSFTIDYRVMHDGEIRYHRLLTFLDERRKGILRTCGVVQDITDIKRNFDELQNMMELWDQSVNLLPIAFCIKDVDDDFRYTTCNQKFADIIGLPVEDIMGHMDSELFENSPELEKVLERDHDAVFHHSTESFEESIVNRKGEKRFLRTFRNHVKFGNKNILIGAATDITDLHHRIALEEVSNNILSTVAGEDNIDTIFNDTAAEILQRIKADRVVLTKFENDNGLTLVQEWCSPDTIPLSSLNLTQHQQIWNMLAAGMGESKIIRIEDLATHEVTSVLMHDLRYKTRSTIIASILFDGKPWGMLFVAYEKQQRIFSDLDEVMMKNCANVIALALKQKRHKEVLLDTLQTQQSILNNINIPILFYDDSGKLLHINKEMESLCGMTSSEETFAVLRSLFKDMLPNQERPVLQAIRTKKVVIFEITMHEREYIVHIIPVLNKDGIVTNVVQSAYDVTNLNELLRQQEIFTFCLEVFFKNDDLEEALTAILEKICMYLHASRAFILRYDNKKQTACGYIEHVSNGTEELTRDMELSLNSGTWYSQIIKQQRLIISQIDSVDTRELFGDWFDVLNRSKIKSIYNAILTCNNELWGDFGLFYENEKHEFTKSELDFLSAVTPQINLLLQKFYAKQELFQALTMAKKSEEEKTRLLYNEKMLNTCLSIISESNTSIDEAFNTLLKVITEHLGGSRSYVLQISEDRKSQYFPYEYARDNQSYVFEKNHAYPFSVDTPWYVKLLKDDIFYAPDLRSEQQLSVLNEWVGIAIAHNTRSLFAAPIRLNGTIWGLIGIAYLQDNSAEINQDHAYLLRSTAHLLEVLLQRKQTYDHLVTAKEQAQTANKAKSFFIASVSHEIRTPLNAIIGFSELLREGGVSPEESADYLHSISYSGTALLELINDVLDLSKLEANQLQIINEPTDFNELASDVMRIFVARAKDKGLELKLEVPELPVLELDRIRIRQILLNLIGNAVKFTNSGSITLSAQYSATGSQYGELRFSVADTGIGISWEDSSKLMEPFVQLTNMRGTNATNNGTGLGLAITRRLIERMNGKIQLESQLGQGSTFHIILHNVKEANTETTNELQENLNNEIAGKSKIAKILLVDDVSMNLKVMSALCCKLGITDITTATSGEEALKLLAKQKYSMILTDMWMPGMNGAELASRIRQNQRYADLPIFAITADVEAKDNFSMANFTGIVLKPVSLDKLKDVFNHYL